MGIVYESYHTEGRKEGTWEETEEDQEGWLLCDPCKVEGPRKKKRRYLFTDSIFFDAKKVISADTRQSNN